MHFYTLNMSFINFLVIHDIEFRLIDKENNEVYTSGSVFENRKNQALLFLSSLRL